MKALKPTLFGLELFVLLLVFQLLFCSFDTGTIAVSEGRSEWVRSFGLGGPVRFVTVGDQSRWEVRVVGLLLNLSLCYVFAAVVANTLTTVTRLRRPSRAYGLAAAGAVGLAFIVSIIISRIYWGYFFFPPELLAEMRDIEKVTAAAAFRTEWPDTGPPMLVIDEDWSLAEALASARQYGHGWRGGHILLDLDERGLLPATDSTNLSSLSTLYSFIRDSGMLAKSKPGYDSSTELQGLAIEGVDGGNQEVLLLSFTGGQLSNDHYPYYEAVIRKTSGSYTLVRHQRFYYDSAGMEGFEGNVP